MSTKKIMPEQDTKEMLCPIRYILTIIGGKWKIPIICLLSSGAPTRYSVIKKKLGDITNVMLSQSLKELEAEKIVHREQYNEVPPRVEYTLTERGISLLPSLNLLGEWAIDSMQKNHVCGAYCEECQTSL